MKPSLAVIDSKIKLSFMHSVFSISTTNLRIVVLYITLKDRFHYRVLFRIFLPTGASLKTRQTGDEICRFCAIWSFFPSNVTVYLTDFPFLLLFRSASNGIADVRVSDE